MDFQHRLSDIACPMFLYGTTPPRASAAPEDIELAASKLIARVDGLPLDGVVVYDVQDESERTSQERPFPFLPTIDPRFYSRLLQRELEVPAVNYKYVGQTSEESWVSWLNETAHTYALNNLVLVGKPSSKSPVDGGGLNLGGATRAASAHPAFSVGGVAIAERHGAERSESQNLLRKAENGCNFFISQAIYQPERTVRLLRDYQRDCCELGVAPRRVFLTFTPVGREKTMEFIKWLGIAIAPETEAAILGAENPLSKSIEICCTALRRILDEPYVDDIPLGLNIESVSIKKEEADASVDMFHALATVMRG
jgi:hypothetical protein